MKNFKTYIAFALLFTIIFTNFNEVYAAASNKTYEEKISKEIKSVKDDEFVDVIVKLKKEIDSEEIKTEVKKSNPNKNKDQLQKQIRKEIVDESVSLAENTQKSILKYLDENKKEGSVKSYKSFFIVNCINIVARKSIVIELAKRQDVEEIIENKQIKIERPEKNFPEAREASLDNASKHVPWNLKAIGADKAQELTKDSSNEVVVGIIDSGVDSSHPAISKNYRGNDSNLSASSWYNTINGKNGSQEKPFDDRGHGTHVCGTILGSKEGSLLGVAPKTKWIAVKVFDKDGETDNAKLLAAGEWILAPTDANGNKHPELAPRIVNNSWGGNSSDGFYQDMVKKWRDAGIFPIFSAGNVSEVNNGGENSIGTPGSYPEAYAVGAIRKDEKVAKFSLRGKSDYTDKWKPDIVAPGVNILSSVPGNKYELYTGTSMASPHVSGVVALMLQANKDLSVEQIEKILNETASPLKDDYYIDSPNYGYGYGKVDAYNAVELSMGQTKGKEVNKDKMGIFSGRLLARGEDNEKPSLDHKAISAVYTIYKTSFDANVKDNTGIDYVKLFLDYGQGFKEYEMKLKRGTRLDGYYNIDIPVSNFDGVSSGRYYIECSDINGSVTKTEEYSFVVKDGVNIGYVQDFETDISGFEFGGESSLWKWGNIKSDEVDNKLIGTGPYSDNLKNNTIAVMPPIDLSKTDKDAVLSFRHWYDLGNSDYAFFDQAEVWIAEVDANSSADNLDWKLKRTYKNSSKDKWVDEFIDLSEYKGKKICLMFGLRANGEWKTKGQGWYIDDIKIEEAVKEIPEKPSKYLSLRSQKNGRYNFSFSPVDNDKITAYELYRSNNPEGPFECIKTVEKGDSNGGFGKWSITLSDIPIPQKGSYYYYAVSKIGKNSSDPSEIKSITFTEGEEFLSYDFENGKQGWTSVSDSGELAWDFGNLEYGDKFNANFKKPTESQSLGKNPGMNMWATNMDDYRLPKSKYSLISPTMNLSGLSDAKIYYQNWFGSSGKRYSDDYGTYNQDLGEIYISKDDGSSWEKIYTLDEKMLDKKGNRHTWFTDGVEIPKQYLTEKTKIKFLLDTGDDEGTDSPEQSGGWYIDDISINTNLNKNKENNLQTENVFENKSPFKLQNMTRASENSLSNNGIIPLVGKITIKETGVSVTSEAGTGKFSIKHPVGSYTAIAEAEGYISKEIPVTITNNSELKEDIYLDKAQGNILTIKVSDENSNPVNANVKIYKQDDLEILKEKDGSNISLDNILPGKYNFIVSADGYKTYREEITISGSKEIVIKLEKINFQEGKNVGYTKEEALELAGQDEKNVTFANKISNNKDVQVDEITYYITKTKLADLQNSSYRISIYDKNDIDGLPGKILYSKDLNFEKEGWNSLKISNVQVDGEFYIAFTKLSGELALGIDNKTSDIDSVKMFNNAWIEPQTKGSYMIGAKLREIEDAQKECTISFKANGGQGSMSEVKKQKGDEYKLPNCEFDPPANKEFDAWEINNERYEVNSSITLNGNLEIKALWKDKDNEKLDPIKPRPGDCRADSSDFKHYVGYTKDEAEEYLKTIEKIIVKHNGKEKVISNFEFENDFAYDDTPIIKIAFPYTNELVENDTITIVSKKYKNMTIKINTHFNDNITIYYGISSDIEGKLSEFTISFDPNNGLGSMEDEKIQNGKNYTIPSCKFDPPQGMVFDAWELDGDRKEVGNIISISKDIKLKALWKQKANKDFTVSFDSNNGSGNMEDEKIQNGENYTIPSCKFDPPQGMVFDAWELDGNRKLPGEKINLIQNIKLKALWIEEYSGELKDPIEPLLQEFSSEDSTGYSKKDCKHKISYDSNYKDYVDAIKLITINKKGSKLEQRLFTQENSTYTDLSGNKHDKIDLVFRRDGFFEKGDEITISARGYKDLKIRFVLAEDYYLNAVYTPEIFSYVKFETFGGSKIDDQEITINYTQASSCRKPENNPTKEGCIFEGWYKDKACNEKFDFDNQRIITDTTIYAKWKTALVEEYTISFKANGGQGSMSEVKKQKGDEYKLPNCEFDPPANKEFDAWEINNERYEVNSSITLNGNLEIKALWKDKDNENPGKQVDPGKEVVPGKEVDPMIPRPDKNKTDTDDSPSYLNPQWRFLPNSSLTDNKKGKNGKVENINAEFKDYRNHWSEKAVDFCMDKGYFKDIAEKSNFNPEKATTRGEFITVLARFAGVNPKDYNNKFTDVDNNKYYAGYIAWASENKIVLGVGNNKFESERPISRAEMATIVHRFSKLIKIDFKENKDLKIFKDEKEIPNWAKEAVDAMVRKGLLEGNKDNTFNPSGEFKRSELAQVIFNISK